MSQAKHQSFNYDVFISYRHLPLDQAVAKKLHTLLETYRLPAPFIARNYPSQLRRVFRDEEEMSTAGILTDSIRKALDQSSWLLVVCTPDTPLSNYVLLEIQTFIELGRKDRILALLVNGEPERSIPESLRKIPGFETQILELHTSKTGQTLRQLTSVIPRIIATCLNCPENELRREDSRRNHRRFLVRITVASMLLISSGLYCYSQWQAADLARRRAKVEKDSMMKVIESLTYTLPEKMQDIAFTYPLVAEVLEQNLQNLDSIIDLNGKSYEALREKAKNYRQLESAWSVLGDQNKACALGLEGLKILQGLTKDKTNQTVQADLADSYNSLGTDYDTKKDYVDALMYYREAIKIQEYLAKDKTNKVAQGNLATSYNNLGIFFQNIGAYDESIKNYQKALVILEYLAKETVNKNAQTHLAFGYSNLGGIYLVKGLDVDAIKYFRKALEIREKLAKDKTSKNAQRDLADSCNNLGIAYYNQGAYDNAILNWKKTQTIREDLAQDKTNKNAQEDLADIYDILGRACNSKGIYDDSIRNYQKALVIREDLGKDKSSKRAQENLADCYFNFGNTWYTIGNYDKAIYYYKKTLVIQKNLLTNNTRVTRATLVMIYNKISLAYESKGDKYNANKFWRNIYEYEDQEKTNF